MKRLVVERSQVSRIRWSVAPIQVSVFVAIVSSVRLAAAAPQDAAAIRLADQAINADYLAAKSRAAETKLKKAVALCGKDQCSPRVLARVYRDLGVVQIAGLKKDQAGREAFARAVQADPDIRLERDLTTPELTQAFTEVGGQPGFAAPSTKAAPPKQAEEEEAEGEVEIIEETPKPAKKKETAKKSEPPKAVPKPKRGKANAVEEEKIVLEEEPEPDFEPESEKDEPATEKPEAPLELRKNYASLTLQQDFLVHAAGKACFGGTYGCFESNDEYEGPLYEGAGNEVSGGFGLATTRLMLGYDRLLTDNLLAGARVGFAFGGGPTPKSTGDGFLPVHLELRAQYHPFDKPFTRRGFRPYAGLGIGFAEVDAKVKVTIYESEQALQAGQSRSLDAWRKTGKSFLAPTFGCAYAFLAASSVFVELRPTIMLGASAFAPALALGYAHGI